MAFRTDRNTQTQRIKTQTKNEGYSKQDLLSFILCNTIEKYYYNGDHIQTNEEETNERE